MKKTMLFAAAAALVGCASVCSTAESVAKPRPEGAYTTGEGVKFTLGIAPYTYHKYDDFDKILEFAQLHDLKCTGIKYFMVRKGVNVDKTDEVRAITDAEIAACKEKAAKAGVKISSIGPVYMSTEDQCDCAFEFAKRMGVDVVVAVPFKLDGKTRVENRELCLYASKKCAETGIKYAIHNHGPDIPYCFPTGESAFNMVKDLDARMGLCLDIGHDFRAGQNPAESIRKYGSRIYDMHIKNVKFDAKKNIAVPMPRGDMDMWEIVKALVEVNYTGCCSLEYERDFKDNLAGVAESIGYFKGLIKAIEG